MQQVVLRAEGLSVPVGVPETWIQAGRCCDVLLARFLAGYDEGFGRRFEAGRESLRARVVGGGAVTAATPLAAALGGGDEVVEIEVSRLGPPARAAVGAVGGVDDAVVVTFVSEAYLPLLDVWLRRFVDATRGQYECVVVCLDEAAARGAEALLAARPSRGAAVLRAPLDCDSEGTRKALWALRLEILARVVEERVASKRSVLVVHSDVDAFWLGDAAAAAAAAVERAGGALGAFSVDYGGRGAKHKGLALCPGWFALKASRDALALLAYWTTRTRKDGDDQRAINHCVDAQLLHRAWAATTSETAERSARRPPDAGAADLDPEVRLVLLPYADFSRCLAKHPPPRPGVVPLVWHPWLDAVRFSPNEKAALWAVVLGQLSRGTTTILDAYYAAAPSATLTPKFLETHPEALDAPGGA